MTETGLLKPGTPINLETINVALESMAMACARGPVQAAAIAELIGDGEIVGRLYPIPGRYYGPAIQPLTLVVGTSCRLQYSSWSNMMKRLKAAGFTFEETKTKATGKTFGYTTYKMYWGVA